MAAVSAENIERVVQRELDIAQPTAYRLVANLFIRRADGSFLVRVEPDREDVSVWDLAERLVDAEDRLCEKTGARISLLPVINDEYGLVGAQIIKGETSNGL